MKTKEELTALRAEVEELSRKLAELTDDELKEVVGGGSTSSESILLGHDMPKKNDDERYVMTTLPGVEPKIIVPDKKIRP